MLPLRPLARDLSLLLCGAVGAFLISTWLAARVAVPLATAMGGSSAVARVVAGALALDLTKAPGLLAAAWLLGATLTLRPTWTAALLVALGYGLDLAVAALLQQLPWLWTNPSILLSRAAVALLLVWLVRLVVVRRRLPPSGHDPGS